MKSGSPRTKVVTLAVLKGGARHLVTDESLPTPAASEAGDGAAPSPEELTPEEAAAKEAEVFLSAPVPAHRDFLKDLIFERTSRCPFSTVSKPIATSLLIAQRFSSSTGSFMFIL